MKRSWNKTIYIAKKLGVKEDEHGNQIPVYDTPQKYDFNVQPASSEIDIQTFGENSQEMQKTVIEKSKYLNEFKEYDVAYLDGVTPSGETENGENANYRLYPPRNQNKCITIYFIRLAGK